MNRRIIQDIKVSNSNKIKEKVIEDIKEVIPEYVAPEEIKKVDIPRSSKYEFLRKSAAVSSSKRISDTPHMRKSKPFSRIILFIFVISLLIGAFYLFSTTFFKAKVTIVPKNKVFNIDGEQFIASKKDGIPFEVMIVEDTESKDIVLTTSKDASDKAKGSITLYNEYSNKPQKISAGAFLSDDKGKSYKLDNTVTIPAYTLDKSSKVVPGQIVTPITSFLPGEAYNGSPTIFYITTFKGTDKYKKIYGHIKGSLSGGATGVVYTIDDTEKASILSNVSSTKDKLLSKLNALVPSGYVLYPNAFSYAYQIDDNFISRTPEAKVDVSGTLSAVLIKKSDFVSAIIDRLIPDISKDEKSEIIEPDLSVLVFNFENKDQNITKDLESFDFQLKGNISLNWAPRVDQLKKLLIDKNKNEVLPIFKQDPGISTAGVSIIPFWSNKLPNIEEKISIILKK